MVFCDLKLTHFEEPFIKFRAHGLLIKEGAKMSKSKGNVVNPDEYIKKFGADTLRMYLMFLAPFEQGGDFKDSGILGISRFLKRVWRFHNNTKLGMDANTINKELIITFNKTIKKVTEDIENLQYNTAISSLMILLNEMEKSNEQFSTSHLEIFLKLLAPFAPFISEELWEGLGHKNSIHKEKWPQYDQKLIKEEKFELVIQINGKVRDKVLVKSDISQKEAEEIVFHREKINKFIAGQKIKKIIFVPNRLINIVMDFL